MNVLGFGSVLLEFFFHGFTKGAGLTLNT